MVFAIMATDKDLPLIAPGEILRDQFMVPLQLTPARLAEDLNVSEKTVLQLISGRRRISKTMAHKLHMRLKTSTQYWLNLQSRHDQQKLSHWQQLGAGS